MHGHNGYTADLIEKFPTKESAMAFGHRLLAATRFDRVIVRDGMPTGDGPATWILTRQAEQHA